MLSRIHNKLGTAGLVVAIVALVAALGGAAYAASDNHLSGGEKKEVKKIAKSVSKPGPAGPQGPAGPTGPAGANGTNGTNGKDGATGPTGPTGPTGKTGPTGVTGPEGSPWTAGGTLPSGKTETGAWSFGPTAGTEFSTITGSFNIPLAKAPKKVIKLKEGEGETAECPGTVTDPKASAGVVCVYTLAEEHKFSFFAEPFIFKSGWGSVVGAQETEGLAVGTWAVTAE